MRIFAKSRKPMFIGIAAIFLVTIIALTIIASNTDDAVQAKTIGAWTLGLSLLFGLIQILPIVADVFSLRKKLSDQQIENTVSELAQAETHLKQHEYIKAADKATAVLQILPKKAEAYRIRAQANEAQGKLASALDDWTSAINLEPGHPFGYPFRATIYKDMGEHQKAIEDFQMTLILTPELSGTLFQLAQEHFLIGEFETARALFKQIVTHPKTSDDEKRLAKDNLGRMPNP